LTLEWSTPASTGLPLHNYTIYYRTDSSPEIMFDGLVPGSVQQFTLQNLNAYTKYYLKLAAVNDQGKLTQKVCAASKTDV